MTMNKKLANLTLATVAGLGVPAGLVMAPTDANAQGCSSAGCSANVTQVKGGDVKVGGGIGVVLGGGSAASVPDHCVKSYHLLIGGQGNSNFNSPEQRECLSLKLVDSFIISSMQGSDERAKFTAMKLLEMRFPKIGPITQGLVKKFETCAIGFDGGNPGVLKNDWVAMMSENPLYYCDSTVAGREQAQREHELAVARASAPQVTYQAPAVPQSCPTPPEQTVKPVTGRKIRVCAEPGARLPNSCTIPCKRWETGTFFPGK
jgi:hypothetical protein